MPDPTEAASGWGPYPETILDFHSEPPLRIDLRQQVADAARKSLISMGFEHSFGIVTAHDPMGVVQSAAANAALDASLQAAVAECGVAQSWLDACNPDGSHCERSVAIALDLQSLIELAYRYEQLALFWYDGETFWIVPVRSTAARLKLPP